VVPGRGKGGAKGRVVGKALCRHHKLSQAAPAAGQSLSWRPTDTGEQDIMSFLYLIFLSSSCFLLPLQSAHAQSISTSTPVPPLQWINLTGLFQGPAAPPLKDASIGYDNTSRTLIVFGGESQGGIPQQSTYLCVISSSLVLFLSSSFHRIFLSLNLDTLTWSSPSFQSGTTTTSPPPRTAAIGGGDFAAS
jgi:hypothetical protein